MKLINPDIIESGERKLVRFIARQLDWRSVRQSIKQAYDVEVNESLEHKSGNLEIHEGDIAYRLNFDFKVNLSLLLSRDGQQVRIDSPELRSRQADGHQPPDSSPTPEPGLPEDPMKDAKAQMASQIAQMISEINK